MMSTLKETRTVYAPYRRASGWSLLQIWVHNWRSRRALARLSPEHLRDVGLTRHEAEVEANRPIWDHSSSWRR